MTMVTVLSGGVGGARAARGFDSILGPGELTVIVNVGDDDRIHGVHVSADLDTVLYTLADREGSQGWGLAGDTYTAMAQLAAAGEDTSFRLGDIDLALCLERTRAWMPAAAFGNRRPPP
jgi:LPPG:FO 2-phospho-L-lactate transferase